MFNNGTVGFTGATTPPAAPGTLLGAENGLSVDSSSGSDIVVLGNDLGDPASPAELLTDRQIVTPGLYVFFTSGISTTAGNVLFLNSDELRLLDYSASTELALDSTSVFCAQTGVGINTAFILLSDGTDASLVLSNLVGGDPFIRLVVVGSPDPTNFNMRNNGGVVEWYQDAPSSSIRLSVNMSTGNTLLAPIAGNVGIGRNITTPDALLQLSLNTAAVPAAPANTHIHVSGADGTGSNIVLDAYASAAIVTGRRAQGTAAAPSAINFRGFDLMIIAAGGYGATGFSTLQAAIRVLTDEGWTDTAQGTQIILATTPNGTTTSVDVFFIDNRGRVGIGVSAPSATLEIVAGSATAGTAPIKLQSGALNTAPEIGAMEFLTDRLYFVKTTGSTRETLAYLSDVPTAVSGTYTPTLTNGANVTSSTANPCSYQRIGNIVTVFGSVSITQTLASVAVELGMSLPIASNLGAVTDLNGGGNIIKSGGVAFNPFYIIADTANDRASFNTDSVTGVGATYTSYFSFQYIII